MNCSKCGKETSNPKFCSRSCAASHANATKPKRVKVQKLCSCGNPLVRRQRKCSDCITVGKDMTLEEAVYSSHHKSSAYALIRTRARTVMSGKPRICSECGYSKHVEVAHIKAISSFSPDTLISVVNDETNLKFLCPNCHWEFDNKNG